MSKLSAKQSAFIHEYMIDLNATQAAIRAGYSKKTARQTAAKMLSKGNIQDYIADAKKKRIERVQIDADYVLHRLHQVDLMDVADILNEDGSIKPIREWPKVWRQTISGIDVQEMLSENAQIAVLKKIKWPDKLRNLELLGKHIEVQAFEEKVNHSGDVGTPVINLTLNK